MNIRLCLSALVAVLLSACTNSVTGQKEGASLRTTRDSVSYGIGTDIGHNIKENLKASHLDSLNIDALFAGMRDGVDSTEKITTDKVRSMVQAYMLEAQKKMMAEQQAAGEAELRKGEAWLTDNGKRPGVITTASGLQYEVLQAGKGPKPTATDKVSVNYRGTLINGNEFDSSYKKGQPYNTNVTGNVIPGWTEALQLMPVGSRWKIYVPSSLGWGPQSPGPEIPANSVTIFEIELLEVQK